MTPNVTCINEALNGRSSKSFIDEGAWAKALADKGDYYLIQFGHNDMKANARSVRPTPIRTFAANIRRYIRDVRAIGAVPVVVTSLSRRNYKDGVLVQDLKDYSAAARRVGMEENVTVIDLNAMSTKLLEGMTQAQADEFDATGHEDQRAENKKSSLTALTSTRRARRSSGEWSPTPWSAPRSSSDPTLSANCQGQPAGAQ